MNGCPCRLFAAVLAGAACAVPSWAGDEKPQLAEQARVILEKNCYRCHGQNGSNDGGFNYVLDFKKLAGKKVIAGDPDKSRLFRRLGINRTMPPEDEKQRPTDADIAAIKKWIEAGAPAPKVVASDRPFLTDKDVLQALRDHLKKTPRDERRFQRYFTLTHLHNQPAAKVKDADLRIYRAALAKLVNSLSWKKDLVVPETIDKAGAVLAVDVRRLDWDQGGLWQEILRVYPYGLKHDRLPDDSTVNELAEEMAQLAGTDLPAVRADWFLATAARPPLYHTLLQLPKNARDLEKKLAVDIADNFDRGELARAAFNGSGVSGQNRLVERHPALHGAYWKSYDFLPDGERDNLVLFPLGPVTLQKNHPFEKQAFRHDGGEIIFNLPNGLQGYLLVNGKDERIDAGPIKVVGDGKKTSGTFEIVNGLSCMACHQHGMIRGFRDMVRTGSPTGGKVRDKVRQLYPPVEKMEALLQQDEERFLRALDGAMGSFLKVGDDRDRDIRDFPEPVSALARWYLLQELTLEDAAVELSLQDAKRLQAAIENNPRLGELGLGPLVRGATIKRERWESLKFFISPYQETARALELGTPKRYQ